MAKIHVDGKTYEVREDQNLLQAILSCGLNLPYFCWHPALDSVGACRQCAIVQYKDENDEKGKLVMACMEPVKDGARLSMEALNAREFRANVIEWLMVNHPHDCPVCDEGGECHLQDMTVMTGHTYREFKFKKRTHHNQYLGPFINHEMNRCIACYRCTRFYRDYAGGDDLQAFGAHDHVYFGRAEDGVLESEFSGNLVEVCPTGVFTDATLKQHYARKWDLQSAPSVCQHCGLGCNTLGGSRYNKMVRTLNRYNSSVNGYFICDRGRFGYEFVNADARIAAPLVRSDDGNLAEVSKDDLIGRIAPLLSDTKKLIGIGSPRASLESNYALRQAVGKDRFFAGISANDHTLIGEIRKTLQHGPARTPSLAEVEQADAVLILGEDLTNTAPMLDLAVKQAIRNQPLKQADKVGIPRWHDAAVRELVQENRGPLYIATPAPTKLDRLARKTVRAVGNDIARLGYAIAHELDNTAPAVNDLDSEIRGLAKAIADDLKNAERPVVISGPSMGLEAVVQAAANVSLALQKSHAKGEIVYTVPECNSLGFSLFEADHLDAAAEAATSGEVETLIILENDLFRRHTESRVNALLSAVENVIVIDHMETATTKQADYVIPAATFAEGDGTLINNEGRAQRFFQVLNPDEVKQESWRWLYELLQHSDRDNIEEWSSHDQINNAQWNALPSIGHRFEPARDSKFRIVERRIPRSPQRYSGRTAMHAHHGVSEPKPPEDIDAPLSFSMEGYHGRPPGAMIPFFWSPGWNSVQATAKYQSEVGGPLRGGDPGIRLINPREDADLAYFTTIPASFDSGRDEYVLAPLYHIFGTDETSARARAIQELLPDPYLALGEVTAEKLHVSDGDKITISAEDMEITLAVQIAKGLPDRVVGWPVGLPGMPHMVLPTDCKVEKSK